MSTNSGARGAEGSAGDALLPSVQGDTPTGTRAPAFDTIFPFDSVSFNNSLSAIRAMEASGRPNGDQPLNQQSPGDPDHIRDWTGVDVAGIYGLHRDNNNGFTIDRIPGKDGKIYQFESLANGGKGNEEKVYTTDADGNRVEVEDPAIIEEITRKANKLENVSYWQDRLEKLNLSDGEKKAVNDLLDAINRKDTSEVKRLVKQYQGNIEGFERVFEALLAQTVITGSGVNLGLGVAHQDGWATFSLFYPGSSKPNLVIRLTK